jgi:transposase
MKKNLFFIGLDISKADFAASIYQTPGEPIVTKEAIPNDRKGFEMLLLWLNGYHIDKKNCRICMEATGVYSQAIAYYLLFQGFPVSVEPPLKVKRALTQSVIRPTR